MPIIILLGCQPSIHNLSQMKTNEFQVFDNYWICLQLLTPCTAIKHCFPATNLNCPWDFLQPLVQALWFPPLHNLTSRKFWPLMMHAPGNTSPPATGKRKKKHVFQIHLMSRNWNPEKMVDGSTNMYPKWLTNKQTFEWTYPNTRLSGSI